MIGRIARRLFGSTLLGAAAALLLAVDGQHLVHSRVSILDIFVMFWALAAFGCLLVDRDRARARLAAATGPPGPGDDAPAGGRGRRAGVGRLGPWSGPRWWRVAGVVCLALCTGVKWSGLFFSAAFLLMSVLWDCSARRAAGVRHWLLDGALRDGAQALLTTLVVLPTVYLATWAGWLHSDKGWGRHWAQAHPATGVWRAVPDAVRSLWHYHHEMWVSASGITTPHDWQANPWAWMVLGRPTLFLNDLTHAGQPGCDAPTCNRMITDLGNPLIWWPGILALGVLLYRWALARDWRAGAVLSGVVAGYLPWFQYQHRTIFEFYAVAFVPWVVLGVTYCLGLAIGPADGDPERRDRHVVVAGAYVVLVVLVGWYFYPITAGEVLPGGDLELRRWLTSWF
jgi:dolichyl-phosphate-mannose-protein mannosyltransferase